MLQTFLLFMNSILIHFKCLLQVPSRVELILSSLYFTRSVPGAGHSIAGSQHFRVVVNTLHGLFLISVHSSSAYNWSWREGNEKCTLSFSLVPISHKSCWLSAACISVTSSSASAVLPMSEVCRNKGPGDRC